jgi:hypothetical protein
MASITCASLESLARTDSKICPISTRAETPIGFYPLEKRQGQGKEGIENWNHKCAYRRLQKVNYKQRHQSSSTKYIFVTYTVRVTHTGGQSIGPGTTQHLIGSQYVERMGTDTDVVRFFTDGLC